MDINYVIGDATAPIGAGSKIIVHVCNDIGAWGAGFVMALSRKWEEPEKAYHLWHSEVLSIHLPPFELGYVQFVKVEEDIIVANMIAQRGVRNEDNEVPLQYWALMNCLGAVSNIAEFGYSIHMPRIGCGLAGGTWDIVERYVKANFTDFNIPVTVYDLA